MIAFYAWTNTQIMNLANAKINLYPEEKADIYIRFGAHMSQELIDEIKGLNIFEHVFCIDPINIDNAKLPMGVLRGLRLLFLKKAYTEAYDRLLDVLCPGVVYDRAIVSWFYAENVFLLQYWQRNSPNMKITFIEEGTGSYCYERKDFDFPNSLISDRKVRFRRYLAEYTLSKRLGKRVEDIIFYQPDFCRPDLPYKRVKLPSVTKETQPVMYDALYNAVSELDDKHFEEYMKRHVVYLSTYSVEGAVFDRVSVRILHTLAQTCGEDQVIAKIHTGNTHHRNHFAASFEDRIFVDRDRYLLEGLYLHLPKLENKIFVSCVSTASITPKFLFEKEPYIIFTYKLYDTYKQCGVERDDWMVESVRASYKDKRRVMVPTSIYELREMVYTALCDVLREEGIVPPPLTRRNRDPEEIEAEWEAEREAQDAKDDGKPKDVSAEKSTDK